ncbi:far upstream element-binding protein 2-like [Homarus americanus]|uniref:far upstream element-binding protein 2-like n=1 Tax=Homarus americanus TaxID=6706 RepID=UPI001C436E04|nr:far upstream element-binding protein 2-like [Homarus americanus]
MMRVQGIPYIKVKLLGSQYSFSRGYRVQGVPYQGMTPKAVGWLHTETCGSIRGGEYGGRPTPYWTKGSKDQPLRVVGLDKGLVQDAADHIKALVQKAVTTTVTIKAPNNMLGVVVGPGGSTIKEIQEKYKVRVFVPQKGSKDQPLRVEGLDKGLVHDAADHIKALVQKAVTTTVTITAPINMLGVVVGPGGSTIKEIQEKYKVRVFVPQKGSKDQPLRVVGLDKGLVHDAADHIKALVQKAVTTTVTITAPNNMLGVVVGPGGSTIKEIQEKYKVRVFVPHKGSKDQPLRVVGPDKGLVQDAADHIESLMAYEKERRRLSTPVSQTVFIPKAHHGLIIGRQGQNIRYLSLTRRITIVLPPKNVISDEVTVTGLPDQVDQGVRDLVNLVKSSTHICYNSDF